MCHEGIGAAPEPPPPTILQASIHDSECLKEMFSRAEPFNSHTMMVQLEDLTPSAVLNGISDWMLP
jgi:hypothetical protein